MNWLSFLVFDMETWLVLLASVLISLFLRHFFTEKGLPPGPTPFPIIGNILLLNKPHSELYTLLRKLHFKYGPVITLYVGHVPMIFVATRSVAHEAFVQKGAIFSGRSPSLPSSIANHNKDAITYAPYGATWRILRSNLIYNFLNTSNVRSFSQGRSWALDLLLNKLESQSISGTSPVQVIDHFEISLYCLQALMTFGCKIEEEQLIRKIKRIHDDLFRLLFSNELSLTPKLGKILFRKQWKKFQHVCEERDEVLLPLVRARKKHVQDRKPEGQGHDSSSYVDTLLDLEIPDENGTNTNLEEDHIVSLCTEVLNGGSHTTAALFHWIMAEIVNSPQIQNTLFGEIGKVVKASKANVEDDDLVNIPYLKAVVLEGLRLHPIADFTFPRSANADVELHGYRVPKGCDVVYTVGEVVTDPAVWEDPLEFRPERFLTGAGGRSSVSFDITGSKEIKMLPFGAGRRICPGSGLAVHNLEYFVANLIWKFNWVPFDGDSVDLSERIDVGVKLVKNPLLAYISPRFGN